jgi:hypothetical protein
MPDDSTALTAKPIPSALAISPQRSAMNVVPQNMAEAIEFARVMSKGGDVIRAAFRDNPGACLAIALQAFRWAADPFAVANKAYLTRNKAGETQIAYEAQLVDAIVHTAGVLSKRLRLRYEGQGTSRKCIVTGWIRGEDEPFEYESPTVAEIAVKNSPLWTADRDQQLAYYSKRAWARRHVPEILLGIYTTDEIDGQIIDVTADRIDAHAASMQQPAQEKAFLGWDVVDHTGEVYTIKSTDRAVEALRKILITAAAISPEALATAWKNNDEFLSDLAEAQEDGAEPLHLLYAQLAPQDSPAADQPEQKGESTVAADRPLGRTSPTQQAGDTSAPDDPAQRSAVDQPTQAPAAERFYHDEPQAEAPAETPPVAASGEDTAPAAVSPQSGDRHDPFWDRDSLRIDPPNGRTGKPDWKAWTALLIPRIRQAWSVPLVNELLDANRDVIEMYASNFGSRARVELMAEFDAALGGTHAG